MPHGKRTSKKEVFQYALEQMGDSNLIDAVGRVGLKTWQDVQQWLDGRTEAFLANRLGDEGRRLYEIFLRVGSDHGLKEYDPLAFVHRLIPLEGQVELARRYNTPRTLRKAAFNRHMPRGHLYAAWLLGLISDAEFAAAPPMHR